MKKSGLALPDLIIVAILLLLLFAWGPLYQKLLSPRFSDADHAAPSAIPSDQTNVHSVVAETVLEPATPVIQPSSPAELPKERTGPLLPERRVVISNAFASIVITSKGGSIADVELSRYRQTIASTSGALVLEFETQPALSLQGIAGFSTDDDFDLSTAGSTVAHATRRNSSGIVLRRTFVLTNQYELSVSDVFSNSASEVVDIPPADILIGPIRVSKTDRKGRAEESTYLGIDVLEDIGRGKVRQWNRKRMFGKDLTVADLFQSPDRRAGCSMGRSRLTQPLPVVVSANTNALPSWVAVKNKFFTQIASLAPPAVGYGVGAGRDSSAEDPADPRTWAESPLITEVWASLRAPGKRLDPGQSLTQNISYYVGPKDYEEIKKLGSRRESVMEFGMFEPVCRVLLWTLNGLYRIIPSYGIAIIILTIIVRIVFWPVTHRSTESMKRMQALQPEMAALREKYRDKPQKLHQEMMALYKAHKVNPLGGCLPTLVQIPVFIAFFVVLRSAIQLRFAEFLWIKDLSEPEGLFATVLPFPLNILPIFMAVTMAWQQKLTPSGGDPSQQRIMMLMPLLMLFLFYSMASALILYWSVNQCLMIAQLLWQRRSSTALPARA